jgi:malyl-CoA/(S)-citramalyl-CoA lyase
LRSPRDFFNPLAIGAPEPLREIPVKPSRMIHFLDFSNEKMVAKAGDIAKQTDILRGAYRIVEPFLADWLRRQARG